MKMDYRRDLQHNYLVTESGAAETGCGKHRDSGGRKGADRRETGTAGKRSCSPSGE